MVKATFENLSADKKQRVTSALLTEFSSHKLTDAQVARIVKEAGIARGAFYKYFDDLTDAYNYVYQLAMKDIHTGIDERDFSVEAIYQRVARFVDQAEHSQYYDLIKMHLAYNESQVGSDVQKSSARLLRIPPKIWAVMELSHATIKLGLFDPENRQANFDRFKKVLEILHKG
ncbi:TetR/AcrR family transcriptional regulator [Lactobacillus corticis]|uniref:TetR family transcriptional regulator n=1 Tax=Lactobacillus corticis TaxID=2201249 RepID=A0A916VHP7_9LACO|nr:TetR/AcrR family transcriptional regulator [Lactobacillus corticis]GFZ26415.1 TetR family transcriptional regulator [Lactobacillus corticis]